MHNPGTIDKDTLIEQQNQQLSKLKIALEKSIDNLKKQCELAQEAHKEVNRLTALNKDLMIKSENFRQQTKKMQLGAADIKRMQVQVGKLKDHESVQLAQKDKIIKEQKSEI